MKTGHLHTMWIIVTLSLTTLAVLVSRRGEKEATPDAGQARMAQRNEVLRARVAELEAELARREPASGNATAALPSDLGSRSEKTPESLGEAPKSAAGSLTVDQIRALLKSGNREDINRALKEIEALSDRGQKLTLLRELLGSSDRGQVSRAVSMLKKMGGPEAVALIAGVLAKEGPSGLRAQAAVALGELGDQSAIPALQEAWRSGDVQVRSGVAVGLNAFGQREPVQAMLKTLSGMLESPDGGVREDAMDILTGIKMPGSLPLMVAALSDPSNNHLREDAADALGAHGSLDALPFLEKALQDPAANVRTAAQRAITRLKTPK